MAKIKKHQLTVQVNSQSDKDRLAEIAAALGFISKGGVGRGRDGSVGQLFQAIADGRCEVVLIAEPCTE